MVKHTYKRLAYYCYTVLFNYFVCFKDLCWGRVESFYICKNSCKQNAQANKNKTGISLLTQTGNFFGTQMSLDSLASGYCFDFFFNQTQISLSKIVCSEWT